MNRNRGNKRTRLSTRGFGRAIRHWRVFAKLTQCKLAELSDVSEAVICQLERERGNVAPGSISRICHGLESVFGELMVNRVFDEAAAALWFDVTVDEAELRKTKNWPEVAQFTVAEARRKDLEKVGQVVDELAAGLKKLLELLYTGPPDGGMACFVRPVGEEKVHTRARVRGKPGRHREQS